MGKETLPRQHIYLWLLIEGISQSQVSKAFTMLLGRSFVQETMIAAGRVCGALILQTTSGMLTLIQAGTT